MSFMVSSGLRRRWPRLCMALEVKKGTVMLQLTLFYARV